MAQTTFSNGIGIAHQNRDGGPIVSPGVCKPPVGPSVASISCPNLRQASNANKGPKSVKTDGEMPMVNGAQYNASSRDEAVVARGVVRCGPKGMYEFVLRSFEGRMERKNASRHRITVVETD